MNALLFALSLLPILVLTSCASGPRTGSGVSAPASPAYNVVTAGVRVAETRILRREGRLFMKTRSVEESAARCVALVRSHKGRMEEASLSDDHYRATIRVPSPALEPLMDSLAELGHVSHRSLSAEDITEQYRDLEAEIKNTRALRDRLRALLARAETVKDTLAIEKELARVQTELDQLEGRLKRLKSEVALSGLSLTMKKGIVVWKR